MKLVFIIVLLLSVQQVFTQVKAGQHKRLAKLYLDQDYEDCLYKAEKMSQGDDYKTDPEVFLYMSMSLYQLSLMEDPEIKELYPNAFRDAIRNAGKAVQKDRYKEYIPQNMDYIKTLKTAAIDAAKRLYNERNYKFCAKIIKELEKVDPNDLHIVVFRLTCEIAGNASPTAKDEYTKLMPQLKARYAAGTNLPDPTTKSLMIEGILLYSNFLLGKSKVDDAALVLDEALLIFPSEGFLRMQYNMITGKK